MIFKGKASGKNHNFTKDMDPGYENFEKFSGGLRWYMMEINDFITHIGCKLKKTWNNSFIQRSNHNSQMIN